MEEEQSCIFVPLWVFCIGFFVLSLIGCANTADSLTQHNNLVFHSCPEQGHGACPICCDDISQDEKVVVLD